jgi:hypothetical protein
MIPEEVSVVLGILSDLNGKEIKGMHTKFDNDLVPPSLWEGFVEDVRYELEQPNLEIEPSDSAWSIYEKVMKLKVVKKEEKQQFLILELQDEVDTDALAGDIANLLEKYRTEAVFHLVNAHNIKDLHREN